MNNFDHENFPIKTWAKYSRSGKLLKNATFKHWEEFCLLAAVIEKTQIPWSKLFITQFLKKKNNQVNRCSRLQDLEARECPNFIRRGKLPTTVNMSSNTISLRDRTIAVLFTLDGFEESELKD